MVRMRSTCMTCSEWQETRVRWITPCRVGLRSVKSHTPACGLRAGKLLVGDDPATAEAEATYVMWSKPERLTSGKRDANLPAVDCAAGAGCILTWQEDPEGLRPGQGLGPGEGWSGAVANQQTDIWYSHISQAEFDLVFSARNVLRQSRWQNMHC